MLNRVKDQLQNYFVGNLDAEKIKQDIKNSTNNVIVEDFGAIGGKFYFIRTDDIKATEALLNELDQSKNGRKALGAVNFFVGGPFILGRSDSKAFTYHSLYAMSLSRPRDYAALAIDNVREYLNETNKASLFDALVTPLRKALAKGLFNIDNVSADLAAAFNAFAEVSKEPEKDVAGSVLFMLMGAYHQNIMKMMPNVILSRHKYLKAAKKFLDSQAQSILDDIHAFGENRSTKNLISRSIIQLIKDEYPHFVQDDDRFRHYLSTLSLDVLTKKYLHDAYILTLPASMIPGNNIVIMVACALTALSSDPQLLQTFRDEVARLNLLNDKADMVSIINEDKATGGWLHQFYLECLRRECLQKTPDELELETIAFRYTEKELNVNGTVIPAHSNIGVLTATQRFNNKIWQEPSKFDPSRFFGHPELESIAKTSFGVGARHCPAEKITEYIFKVFVSYIALNFDFSLQAEKKGEKDLRNIQIQFNPIEHQPQYKMV